ncbi:DNA (cytosine-5-)-methyltransferase [Corynebacterium sp.]|uniref:DNA cytosine methyltransferase n=1 Tax=Corynebacterium sp. TaxID=1720 RepID=UPI0028AEDDFE|nr:DNA (cytosine-5-)-methyltransferase [Corynebacterium sp.]
MTDLTIGSLFSGYGGLDLAVAAVTGAEVAWHCEFDDAPARILAHHWPDVPNHRDVTTIDWSTVEPVDIITGGSPCQDLSAAGKRAGMTEGTRSNLWVNMREAIAALRPRLVVWENVRGALSATATSDSDMEPGRGPLGEGMGRAGHLRALGRVLGDLAELGYDAQWTLVRASDVGAPHHRARVFLIAYPADAERIGVQAGGQPQPGTAEESEPVDRVGALPDDLTHLPTPRASDNTGTGTHGTGGMDLRTAVSHLPTPNASDSSGGGQTADKRAGHSRQLIDAVLDLDQPHLPTPTVGDRAGAAARGGTGFGAPLGEVVRDFLPTPSASNPNDGESVESWTARRERVKASGVNGNGMGTPLGIAVQDSLFGKYAPVVHRWETVRGVPAPAPTELNRNGKPRLNAAFAEWMMGLPPGWVTAVPGVTRAQQLKAIGNGVCPQQAAAALTHLLTEDAK